MKLYEQVQYACEIQNRKFDVPWIFLCGDKYQRFFIRFPSHTSHHMHVLVVLRLNQSETRKQQFPETNSNVLSVNAITIVHTLLHTQEPFPLQKRHENNNWRCSWVNQNSKWCRLTTNVARCSDTISHFHKLVLHCTKYSGHFDTAKFYVLLRSMCDISTHCWGASLSMQLNQTLWLMIVHVHPNTTKYPEIGAVASYFDRVRLVIRATHVVIEATDTLAVARRPFRTYLWTQSIQRFFYEIGIFPHFVLICFYPCVYKISHVGYSVVFWYYSREYFIRYVHKLGEAHSHCFMEVLRFVASCNNYQWSDISRMHMWPFSLQVCLLVRHSCVLKSWLIVDNNLPCKTRREKLSLPFRIRHLSSISRWEEYGCRMPVAAKILLRTPHHCNHA